jgi:hypothetical protein
MDAFPDYTRFDRSKKVLAAIQVISDSVATPLVREATKTSRVADENGMIINAASGSSVDVLDGNA